MNRRDLEQMKQRLAARSSAESEDHPALIALAAILFGLAIVSMSYL